MTIDVESKWKTVIDVKKQRPLKNGFSFLLKAFIYERMNVIDIEIIFWYISVIGKAIDKKKK